MVEVIELDGTDDSGSPARIDERLDGDYLVDEPLSSYLGDRERVAFVIHAKRGGVTLERDGDSETYKPTRGHRTVVAVTDLRLVIAVGGADDGGDRVISIPFSAVTRIDTDSGLLRDRLRVRTEAGEQWSLPAGGDVQAIVSYLEESKAAWSQADRFGARVDEQLVTARRRLEDGEPEAAREAAAEAVSVLATGREQVRTFDVGDRVLVHADFDSDRQDARTVQRRALVMLADDHLDRADHHEAAGRLRAAHEALRNARAAAEQARSIGADQPPDAIDERLQSIERDLARLEQIPRETAVTALNEADAVDDSRQRARRLAAALRAHRDWLSLCWGPDAPFDGDTETIRERILEIVDALVGAHTAVIERHLAAAEQLHATGRINQALAACDAAGNRLATARETVSELAPDQRPTVTQWRIAIDHQRALIEYETSRDSAGSAHSAEWDDHSEPVATSTGHDRSEREDTTVAGITARDTDSADPSESDAAGFVSISDNSDSDADRRATLDAAIRAMDESSFTTFVASCWRELGWETTIFAQSSAKYDIMAIRRRAIDLRVLIWTVHAPGQDLDASVVDRCVTDRDDSDRADAAALVTTADVSEPVRQRAADHDIKLLDHEALLDLVEDQQLTDLVLDAE